MKATIERDSLLKALAHVSGVAEKQTLPSILSNVLVRFDKQGNVHLCATDSEVEMQESLGVDIVEDGDTTVPAQVLHQIVDRLPDGAQIEISKDKGKNGKELLIKCDKAQFSLQILPSDEFPLLSQADDANHSCKIAGKELFRLLTKTKSAISDAGPRYYLQGVYLHKPKDADALRAVATDGHRLAHVEVPVKGLPADLPDVIVPRKAVLEVLRLLDADMKDDVELRFASNKISFVLNGQQVTSKLIDGQFPDYNRVIPQENDKTVKIDIKSFIRKVMSVAAISREAALAVRLKLEADKIVMEAAQSETGHARDELAVGYGGEALEIGFNAGYLRDIAEQIEADTITMEIKDSNSPVLLRDDADAHALYVLMPMRV